MAKGLIVAEIHPRRRNDGTWDTENTRWTMPVHNFTEGLENTWTMVRETASSQRFKVTCVDGGEEVLVDIHYTPAPNLLVTLILVGTEASKGLLTPVLNDVATVATRRGDYTVIDYSLADSVKAIHDGNFSIDRMHRR